MIIQLHFRRWHTPAMRSIYFRISLHVYITYAGISVYRNVYAMKWCVVIIIKLQIMSSAIIGSWYLSSEGELQAGWYSCHLLWQLIKLLKFVNTSWSYTVHYCLWKLKKQICDPEKSCSSYAPLCDPEQSCSSYVQLCDPEQSCSSYAQLWDPENSCSSYVQMHDPEKYCSRYV